MNSLFGWCNFHWFVDKGPQPDNHKPCCSTSHRTQSHRGKYISKDHRDVILHCCFRIIQDAKKAHVPSFTPVSTEQCGWWTAPVPSTGIYLGTRDQRTRMCNGFSRFHLFCSTLRSRHIFHNSDYIPLRNNSRDTPSYRDVQLWIFKRRFNGQQITYQIYLKYLDMIFISLKFLETKNSKNWSFKIISPTSLYRDRFIKEINIVLNNEHAGSLIYSLPSKEIYLIVAWGNASMYRFTWYNVNYWRFFELTKEKKFIRIWYACFYLNYYIIIKLKPLFITNKLIKTFKHYKSHQIGNRSYFKTRTLNGLTVNR